LTLKAWGTARACYSHKATLPSPRPGTRNSTGRCLNRDAGGNVQRARSSRSE
jgi:hypothetical protein